MQTNSYNRGVMYMYNVAAVCMYGVLERALRLLSIVMVIQVRVQEGSGG